MHISHLVYQQTLQFRFYIYLKFNLFFFFFATFAALILGRALAYFNLVDCNSLLAGLPASTSGSASFSFSSMLQFKALQRLPFLPFFLKHRITSSLLHTAFLGLTSTFLPAHTAPASLLFPGQVRPYASALAPVHGLCAPTPTAGKDLPPNTPMCGSFLHLLQIPAQKSPDHHLKHSTLTLHIPLLNFLFFHSTFAICFFMHFKDYLFSPIECKFQEGRNFHAFFFLHCCIPSVYVAHSRCSINKW